MTLHHLDRVAASDCIAFLESTDDLVVLLGKLWRLLPLQLRLSSLVETLFLHAEAKRFSFAIIDDLLLRIDDGAGA
jgi:hypothetical protein